MMGFALVFCTSAFAQDLKEEKLDIDWPAAKAAADESLRSDKQGVDRFRAALPGNLNDVGVPVLVTGTGPVRATPRLQTQGDSYAALYPLDRNATLSIMGTARGVALSGDAGVSTDLADYDQGQFAPLDDDADEGGASNAKEADFSFTKFGAAYTLRISCADANDERCLKEDFARSVASSLVQVGGRAQ
ncbi:hypothetical protein JOH50_006678 [Rhizobium leguminosarum]|uniref:hypothetical protein n=1 Tax=Rhizobium leguminosarum TaxID=384 RepID=UPI001AE92EE5|nr:hypothetical protein [Rhizobium leguminosarum]MBP2490882.1 hypothetical protein [Rhizobium leguminosarum]